MRRMEDIVLDDEPLRSEDTHQATGEEVSFLQASGRYDVVGPNPDGSLSPDVASNVRGNVRLTNKHNIATWNVRSMAGGKLEIVKSEMERTNISVLGISELKWTEKGSFRSDKHTVYYSGHGSYRKNGVAFIISRHLENCVMGFNPISDRLISIRIKGKPVNLTVVQAYSPTSVAEEEEIDEFYQLLEETVNNTPKKDALILLGDFNAKVGRMSTPNVTGNHGLGIRNEAGNRLVQFCTEFNLTIMNTHFQQPNRRLYTWTSPGGVYRNQIDYIICQQRWKSMVQCTKTLPGADCGSDHELLTAVIKVKLKKIQRNQNKRKKYDLENIPDNYPVTVYNRFQLLSHDEPVNKLWEDIKIAIKDSAEQTLTVAKPQKRRKWLSEQAIKVADERRKAKKERESEKYKQLNQQFQRLVRRDKNAHLIEECKIMETHSNTCNSRKLFKKVKSLSGKFNPRLGVIKSKEGNVLTCGEEIKDRWREYTQELYQRDPTLHDHYIPEDFTPEPQVTFEEVKAALKSLPNQKSPGIDEIPIELIKAAGKPVLMQLTRLCQAIWNTLEWPRDWKRSVYLPLPKKGDIMQCANNRTIALICHCSKVLLRVIQKRMEQYMERELPEEQAGFRRGRGTCDHIANMRWLMETAREHRKEVFFCFIDYSKAFDCIDHNRLWNVLKKMGIPEHLIRLMRNLYGSQEATVRTSHGDTDWFNIGKGVRQGCILSPYLFNLYAEAVMRSARLHDVQCGIKIAGRNLNNLRYADDTTLMAENVDDLKYLLKRVKRRSSEAGLYLNIKKTKVLTTGGLLNFTIDGEEIEIVHSFNFLGSLISEDGGSSDEIKRRLGMARSALSNMHKIIKSNDISKKTKIKIVETMIFPIAIYGSETWTIKKQDRKRIDAFELWCWRRVLKIPWTKRETNKSVIERVEIKTTLEGRIVKQRLRYFGHIIRKDGSLEKDLMLPTCEGRRRRGRPRQRWIDGVTEVMNRNLRQLKEDARDRGKWRKAVHDVTKSRRRLDGT